MTIGRIDAVEPVQSKGTGRIGSGSRSVPGDSVHISTEAKERAEMLGAVEMVSAAPDVRSDRVAELKAKINDPAYFTEAVIAGTADRLVDILFPPSM